MVYKQTVIPIWICVVAMLALGATNRAHVALELLGRSETKVNQPSRRGPSEKRGGWTRNSLTRYQCGGRPNKTDTIYLGARVVITHDWRWKFDLQGGIHCHNSIQTTLSPHSFYTKQLKNEEYRHCLKKIVDNFTEQKVCYVEDLYISLSIL